MPGMASPSRLETLYGILGFLQETRDPDEDKVWERILVKLALGIEAAWGAYYSYLETREELVLRAATGTAGAAAPGRVVKRGQGLCGWTALYKEPLYLADASGDPRLDPDLDGPGGAPVRSLIAVPLLDRLDFKGALVLVNKSGDGGRFEPGDLELALAACRAASTALRANRLEAMVDKVAARHRSVLENLTGGFIAVDTHGRMILANPAARQILGMGSSAALNVPIHEALLSAPPIAEILIETLQSRKTAKRAEIRLSVRGREVLIGYSTILIQDPQGDVGGAGINFQDITPADAKGGQS